MEVSSHICPAFSLHANKLNVLLIFDLLHSHNLSPNPVYIPFCYWNTKMLQQSRDCCFPNHQAHHPFTPLSAIHYLRICCYLASCCSCSVSYWGEICYKFQLNFLQNLPRISSTCWDVAYNSLQSLPSTSMWHYNWAVIFMFVTLYELRQSMTVTDTRN